MSHPYDIVRVTSVTVGTSDFVLGPAVLGFKDYTGIPNGTVVDYTAEQGGTRETGQGAVSGSGTALTRTKIYASTNAGAKVAFTGGQEVFITEAADSLFIPRALSLHQAFGAM